MNKDIIYKEDAIKVIHSYWKGELNKMPTIDSEYGEVIDGDYSTLLKHNKELSTRIKDIPSADRPQGEWIEMYRNGFGNMVCMCSKCNFHATKSNFCPNCGADMKEREDK